MRHKLRLDFSCHHYAHPNDFVTLLNQNADIICNIRAFNIRLHLVKLRYELHLTEFECEKNKLIVSLCELANFIKLSAIVKLVLWDPFCSICKVDACVESVTFPGRSMRLCAKTGNRAPSQHKNRFPSIGISMLKIRRSRDRLIFNMGILYYWDISVLRRSLGRIQNARSVSFRWAL